MNHTSNIHCVGVAGAGVSALAEYYLKAGSRVTGSDAQSVDKMGYLVRLGAVVRQGHSAEFVTERVDTLIYSLAIPVDNPERRRARDLGIPEISYPAQLGRLMLDRTGVAVTGTHGKSTTTAMLGWILEHADLAPDVILGARVNQLGAALAGHGEHCVVEASEFRRSFIELTPQAALLTNMDLDTQDTGLEVSERQAAYREFVELLPADGLLISRSCENSAAITAGLQCRTETFSLNHGANWWGADLKEQRGCYRFRVFHDGDYVSQINLQVPGRHNVENALGAVAMAVSLGVSPAVVREALEEFKGCRRRLETLGSWRGATLIDDQAHHPTECKTVLKTLREVHGKRRIVTVFQPHQISRTERLFDDLAASFDETDEIMVSDIYSSREPMSLQAATLSRDLAETIAKRGVKARYFRDLGMITRHLESTLEPGDVVVTLGAGDVWKVTDEFARRLSRYRQAG